MKYFVSRNGYIQILLVVAVVAICAVFVYMALKFGFGKPGGDDPVIKPGVETVSPPEPTGQPKLLSHQVFWDGNEDLSDLEPQVIKLANSSDIKTIEIIHSQIQEFKKVAMLKHLREKFPDVVFEAKRMR